MQLYAHMHGFVEMLCQSSVHFYQDDGLENLGQLFKVWKVVSPFVVVLVSAPPIHDNIPCPRQGVNTAVIHVHGIIRRDHVHSMN